MEKLNIAEILKDCPIGMELDSTIIDGLYFGEVTEHNMIKCYTKQYRESTCTCNTIYFHCDGTYLTTQNAKCVIFPKGKTTWEGFQRPFKDGDIIYTRCKSTNTFISIFKEIKGNNLLTYCDMGSGFYTRENNVLCGTDDITEQRLATKEETHDLFNAIKRLGYKWNAETKTLEKLIIPKFKVGDQIVKRNSISNSWIVASVSSEYYGLKLPNGSEDIGVLPISEQDNWKLMSVVPKFKVGDRITNGKVSITIDHIDNNYYYEIGRNTANVLFIKNQDEWRLDKFDITTLKPFESRVLVRSSMDGLWKPAVFGFRNGYNDNAFYIVGGSCWKQCIPYLNNEHLCGTTNDCDDYYKTWV